MVRRRREYRSRRAVPHLRQRLGGRVRALRKEAGLTMVSAGARAGLSAKFLGEVERGEKSLSVDSLYHLARALGVPMRVLLAETSAAATGEGAGTNVFALVARLRKPGEVRRAHAVLRRLLGGRA